MSTSSKVKPSRGLFLSIANSACARTVCGGLAGRARRKRQLESGNPREWSTRPARLLVRLDGPLGLAAAPSTSAPGFIDGVEIWAYGTASFPGPGVWDDTEWSSIPGV